MEIHPIRTEQDHRTAVARVEQLISAAPGTSEADELDILATLIVEYEANQHAIDELNPVLHRTEEETA